MTGQVIAPIALDRDIIIDTALRLVKRDGLDRLTTRSLAGELGVKGPALYWHFSGKQALLTAMAGRIMQTALDNCSSAGGWREQLAALALMVREVILQQRDGAKILSTVTPDPITQIGILERLCRPLCDAGAQKAEALRAVAGLSGFVLGCVIYEQMDAIEPAGWEFSHEEAFTLGLEAHLAGISMTLFAADASSSRC